MNKKYTTVPGPTPISEVSIPKPPDWRNTLTPDELATVQRAAEHVAFFTGAWSNSPLVLVDKLAKLLDDRAERGR